MHRREFVRTASGAVMAAAATSALKSSATAAGPNDRVNVAVIGVRGRGGGLLNTFAELPTVSVKYVCDIDQRVLNERTDGVASKLGRRPETLSDFRKALDDPEIDAIVLGTPDHWHALPTIFACQAGKDVYVEKPDGHNIIEGRTMVAAAKKYNRVVQMGTQSRSSPHLLSAMEYLQTGVLGRVLFAKAWESGLQGSIGHPPDAPVPEGVDYDFWLGPAPKRPFNPMRYHSNWRWFFDYGTGDLGNDGVHRLDYARWAFDTARRASGQGPLPDFPTRVSASGGKYYFDDDQEWPDTLMVTYDYPGAILTYELRVWNRYQMHGESEGAVVCGDKGYIIIGNRRWRAFGLKDEPLANEDGDYDNAGHAQNFIDCMHSRGRPAADLETIGHPSSALCHLGNIAWRTGRTVAFDPKTYTFGSDEEANRYLTRAEYRKPWLLPKIEEI